MINTLAKGFARKAAPLAALAMGAALSGCGFVGNWDKVDGEPLAELDMTGDAPTKVSLSGPDTIEITEGATFAITLEGDADAGAALRFDRDGDSLAIRRDKEAYDGNGKAVVRITMPAASRLAIAGSGTIKADTMANDATIKVAGSGDITVASLAAEKVDVSIAGSGDVTAAGTAKALSVDIAGNGDVKFGGLTADEVDIGIAGSGDVDLASNGKVKARIAGSGDITVTGTAECTLDNAGSGTLTCRSSETVATEEVAAE